MLALDPKTRSFTTHAFRSEGLTVEVRQGAKLSGWEKSEPARKIQKSWEQSQGVRENKGHDFLRCCNWCGFCALMRPNRVPKGVKNPHAAQNEPRLSTRGAVALELTRSRLDKRRFSGPACKSNSVCNLQIRVAPLPNATTDPGMCMKTKDRQFGSRDVEELRSAPFRGPMAGAERQPNLFTPRLLDSQLFDCEK